MPNKDDLDERKRLAALFLRGRGVEIGAGLDPVIHSGITDLTFVDKRRHAELQKLFGRPVRYAVVTFSQALAREPVDFVMAHHVVEHCPNPIRQISDWLLLLKETGRIFFSIPSDQNSGESGRIPVSISHLLHDYLFDREGDDFESKQHIPHFILQWATLDGPTFSYATNGVKPFAAGTLSEVRRSGHDLHWHTYPLDVFCHMIEAAFWFAGCGLQWLHRDTTCGAHYVVAERAARSAPPRFMTAEGTRLMAAARRLPMP